MFAIVAGSFGLAVLGEGGEAVGLDLVQEEVILVL